MCEKTEKHFFGPLTLHQKNEKPTIFKSDETVECTCVLCYVKFALPVMEKQLLTHLFTKHRLVIADVNQIADLNAYIRYWRMRFNDKNLPFFCTTMLLDSKPDGTKSENEEYYLLSDVLPEDKELRSNLQQTKLEKLLELNKFEREDKNYIRECLFCRNVSNTTRASYLHHLYIKHNFLIAKPANLIFIDDLINKLALKLEKLQCIYCEGYFKDRNILKEHMRKKGHKRINAENKEYDKYFIVNYVGDKDQPKKKIKTYTQYGKLTERFVDFEQDSDDESDHDWSDWSEENGPLMTCLFCDHREMDHDSVLVHMKHRHEYSFLDATEGLNYYHKMKIVNYIRRQMYLKRCLSCDRKFHCSKNLVKHIKEKNHWAISTEKWDQPEYYFPTYEDDLFLCYIIDDDESSNDEEEIETRNSMSDSIAQEMAMAVLED